MEAPMVEGAPLPVVMVPLISPVAVSRFRSSVTVAPLFVFTFNTALPLASKTPEIGVDRLPSISLPVTSPAPAV